MIKLVYDKGNCVHCPPEMGCMGRECPQCWEFRMTCDRCQHETEELYKVDDEQMCGDCFDTFIAETYPHITYDNAEDYIS